MVEGAVRDAAAEDACDTADLFLALEVAVAEDDILYRAAIDVAEEADAFVIVAAARNLLIDAYAADGVVLPVEGAPEVMAVSADGGEVVFAGVRRIRVPFGRVGVGDVGGLPEGEALTIVAEFDIGGEVVEVGGRGNRVGVAAEAGEVGEGDGADGVVARGGAGVSARARDGDGGRAHIGGVGVTHGVVGARSERPALVGDGGHRLDGAAGVDVRALDAADGGVAVVERLVGHEVEVDDAEGLARRDGDGDAGVVVAGRGGAARDAGAVQLLDRGAVEPEVFGIEHNRDLAARGDVGEVVGRGEVDRAGDGDAAPIEIDVLAIEGAAIALRPCLGEISHKAIDFPCVIGYSAYVAALSREGHGFGDGGESLLPREDGYYGKQRGEDFFEL